MIVERAMVVFGRFLLGGLLALVLITAWAHRPVRWRGE